LQQHLALIGDMHSHPVFSAKPSEIDKADEFDRPGLHIIAGYIDEKWNSKIEFYCCAVLDGERFEIKEIEDVMEPYVSSDIEAVPQEWLDKVKAKYSGGSYYSYDGQSGHAPNQGPDKADNKVIAKVLSEFIAKGVKPDEYEVRSELFRRTKVASYVWCEEKAGKFVANWGKHHEEIVETETEA